ncbi:MAG TPA: transglycosylase SLT domain-containing protein [Nitrospirota bacterium]|nr:transglycosylase SLT domain-containing protein [Nitrospirota bacterium]
MRPFYWAFAILVCSILVTVCFPARSRAGGLDGMIAGIPAQKMLERGDDAPPRPSPEEQNVGGTSEAASSGPETAVNDASEDEEEESGEQPLLDAALDLLEASREYLAEGEADKALEALDQAYSLIIRADPGGDPKLIQQKEDLRFTIAKRTLELYTARYTAVQGGRETVPVATNKHVEREIRLFQNKDRGFFLEAYKRSGRYRGGIVKALKEAGLPEELSWLPLVESGFNPGALSRARALGLWQFVPSTGYKFGLMRNDWIDERMDPEKSTMAAIAYLKELHRIFGDWAAALTAYHCGEGTVLKAIRKQKINYLDNFWDLYELLPDEAARYYPRFLAALTILKDPGRYGLQLEEPEEPRQCEVVTVDKPLLLGTVAKSLGLRIEDLAELNPELRRRATPEAAYPLMVPAGKGEFLRAALSEMEAWSPPKKAYVFHRVRKGETLSRIALQYRTSIRAIADSNNLRRGQVIRVGQRLKIPFKGTS